MQWTESETQELTFRKETNQEFMKEIKKEWTEAKNRELRENSIKSDVSVRSRKINEVLKHPVVGRIKANDTLFKNNFTKV